jgi:hypothetical protein
LAVNAGTAARVSSGGKFPYPDRKRTGAGNPKFLSENQARFSGKAMLQTTFDEVEDGSATER